MIQLLKKHISKSHLLTPALLVLSACSGWLVAQTGSPQSGAWLKHGTFIADGDLPAEMAASHKIQGARMKSADLATVSLTGTLTDYDGTRQAQITIQATCAFKRVEAPGGC